MENEMKKDTENDEIFHIGEIISYNYKYTAKIIKIHKGGKLLNIIIYHPSPAVVTSPTSVSSSLCEKFKQI